jgi:hypothetical protein
LVTLVALGVCLWTAYKGSQFFLFKVAQANSDSVLAWIDETGVSFAARDWSRTTVADGKIDQATAHKRLEDVKAMLAVRPMSSENWLKLAERRLTADEPASMAAQAFELSVLTAPNDRYLMVQRGLFGIWQWEDLSPDVRRRAMADLAATPLSARSIPWLKKVLSEMPEGTRQEIRSTLRAQGMSAATFERIGL